MQIPGGSYPPVDYGLDNGHSAEKLLQVIFDNNYEGLLVVSRQGSVTQINPALATALRKTPEQMIGHPLSEVCRHSGLRKLAAVLRSGRPEFGKVDNIGGRSVLVDYLPIMDRGGVHGALAKVTFLNPGQNEGRDEVATGRRSKAKGSALRQSCGIQYTVEQILGSSLQMMDLKETAMKVAPRNSNVLITGESGTGKELFAQAVHAASLRRSGPFIKINCAAVPETLLESEFFGYEEGAFTGGKKGGQTGKLELANGGTVFLDEIGDLSFALQAKLLRFIQSREIQKLGSVETIASDVRVVTATNVHLDHLVKYKKFREDLYYRLNVVNLNVPPLRERKEDIPELVDHFIRKFNRQFGLRVQGITPAVKAIFQRYSWPGNVRELENAIERAFNVLESNIIAQEHLPEHFFSSPDAVIRSKDENQQTSILASLKSGHKLTAIVEQTEKMVILQALMYCQGNKARAAQLLGVSRPGLYKKLVKYGMV